MYNTVYIILIRHCDHLLVVVYKLLSRTMVPLARSKPEGPAHEYTRLVSNPGPTWSSRCCFTACRF